MTIAATTPASSANSLSRQPLTLLGLLVGVTLAPMLAFNQTPSATLYNQLLAFLGFGLLTIGLGWSHALRRAWDGWRVDGPRLDGVSLSLLVMLTTALSAPALNGLPWSMALTSAAMLSGALLVLQVGRAVRGELREAVLTWFCVALLGAGLLSVAVCLIQMFLPDWADGNVIARSGLVGRAVGNMRQPNHLASLLMWACVAAVWLAQVRWRSGDAPERRADNFWLGLVLFLLVFSVLLSASRTGMLGVGLLAVWGVCDRRLRTGSRWALALTPVMLAISWGVVAAWTHAHGDAFGAESRLAEGAGSPSRLAILSNAFTLLQRYPWTGTGWGEFNLAWTMTAFPGRPTAFFDHTHNLAMQVLVEMGWPLGLLTLALMLWGVWQALRLAWRDTGSATRCAFMLVAMIGLHSVFEYPLWYAYFLLPAAFALGLCLSAPTPTARAAAHDGERSNSNANGAGRRRLDLVIAGLVMVVLVPLTVVDYLRVVHIYAPPMDAAPLDVRIAEGQRSPLFALQADYAAATVNPPGPEALAAAQRTGHHLIDLRLMIAWAKSLHATGQTDQARYLVQRMREFRNPQGDEFLEECGTADDLKLTPRPFQCDPPSRAYDYRAFRGTVEPVMPPASSASAGASAPR